MAIPFFFFLPGEEEKNPRTAATLVAFVMLFGKKKKKKRGRAASVGLRSLHASRPWPWPWRRRLGLSVLIFPAAIVRHTNTTERPRELVEGQELTLGAGRPARPPRPQLPFVGCAAGSTLSLSLYAGA